MKIRLKPCPFEHDEPYRLTMLHISDANGRGFAVSCSCGAQGPMAYEAAGRYNPGSRREARARTQARHYWNDRAIPG